MLVAMGITAFLCIAIGVVPGPLYAILPYQVNFQPYTTTHVITQLQLLLFSALAFGFLMRTGLYPPELRSVNLDFDWFYRRLLFRLGTGIIEHSSRAHRTFMGRVERRLHWFIDGIFRHHGPGGVLARTWPTGSTVLWVAVLLALYMIFYFV
jgi:multicomponent Na+:H+ antiporter subunit D